MSIRRHKILFDSATAGNGDWVRLDVRREEAPSGRPIRVVIVAGDTLELQGILLDIKAGDEADLTTLADKEIASLATYTQTENDVLDGNWTYIRMVKTGANGIGYAEGFV